MRHLPVVIVGDTPAATSTCGAVVECFTFLADSCDPQAFVDALHETVAVAALLAHRRAQRQAEGYSMPSVRRDN
jgi:hypothetical protein